MDRQKALLNGGLPAAAALSGLEHLTSILHYLRVVVHPNKLPISLVHNLMHGSGGDFHDAHTLKAIEMQVDEFLQF